AAHRVVRAGNGWLRAVLQWRARAARGGAHRRCPVGVDRRAVVPPRPARTGCGVGRGTGTGSIARMMTLAPAEVDQPTDEVDVTADRPWVVIVWNDPINLMDYVTFVFQKLFGYSREKATMLMLDAHEKGRAVVSNGTREKAELDVFRLHEHGLWATMQHDE